MRLNKHLNIALSPLRLSPNNHKLGGKAKVEMKEAAVFANFKSARKESVPKSIHKQSLGADEQSSIVIQAAAMHNPSKRSIEFVPNKASVETKRIGEESSGGTTVPDIIEYELESFD